VQNNGPSILHLTSVHRPFDHRIFHKECRSLARAGYNVTLMAPSDMGMVVRDGVQVVGIRRPSSRWGRPWIWLTLLREAVTAKPSLVHIHDPELLAIVPWLRLRLGRSVRIVYDVHEYFVDSIAQKSWIPRSLRAPAAWLASTVERLLGSTVDGLVLVIEEQSPLYSGWRAIQAIAHNYPDPATFANPVPLPKLAPGRFRLIYIGSLYARRGIMIMLEALLHVIPHAPETQLVLGGAFETEEFRQQVTTFLAENNLGDQVVLLDWIDHAQLKDYLGSADVAWLPGLFGRQYERRSISTKQLECMLMGLPIVAGDHPYLRVFIDEAQCGFSVPAEDPHAHAEAILWLHQHPAERQEMGKRGRQLVLARYNWGIEAVKLLRLYDQLLGQA
jgi:glycosyltransferase involved in cell wall biosynthesis